LIIERGENELIGRVNYNDNLIVDFAPTVLALENRMKALLFDFEEVNPDQIAFNHYYDVMPCLKNLTLSTSASLQNMRVSIPG
jgi:hypothetical protein